MFHFQIYLYLVISIGILSINALSKDTFYFSSEDFDNPNLKGHEIFESGPISKMNDNKRPVLWDDEFQKDADKAKPAKSNKCHAHTIPNKCTMLTNCDVVCTISLSGEESKMKITFPCQKGSPLIAKVKLMKLKKKVEYSLTVNSNSGTVIKELGYSIGHIELEIKLSVTMNKITDDKIAFKVYSTTMSNIQGYGNSKLKTKMLDIRRAPLTDKCVAIKGQKTKPISQGAGPCAKLRLPSICAITPDCTYITCSLKFMGQSVVMLFKLNKCSRPMTLLVGVKISTLHINWERKLKSGVTIPIPGYAVSAGGVDGGVLIDVLLRPSRGKLQLQIKLLVGVKLGFIRTFPVNFSLLKLRLPIKINGCGKTSLKDKWKRKKDYQRPTSTVVRTIRPTHIKPTEDEFVPKDWE